MTRGGQWGNFGGGIFLHDEYGNGIPGSVVADAASQVTGNGSWYGGGLFAMSFSDAPLSVAGLSISGNSATYGGGIASADALGDGCGTLSLSETSIVGNTGEEGGGLYVDCPVTLTDSAVLSNHANREGGGACLEHEATLTSHETSWGDGPERDNTPDDVMVDGISFDDLATDFACDSLLATCWTL